MTAYGDDLAYIHDAGFGRFAREATPWLLKTIRPRKNSPRLVVDLGCGSGIWAEALVRAGYDVLGYDISAAMVRIARKRVPAGTFRQASCLAAKIPPCLAVTALGEVFNYLFDRRNSPAQLERLFRRVHDALIPGGVFIFDIATPGRVPGGLRSSYTEGEDWACLFTATEDSRRRRLTREITSFRRVGRQFRRDHEVHRLRLIEPGEVRAALEKIGFRVRTLKGYGREKFPPGWVGFAARKK